MIEIDADALAGRDDLCTELLRLNNIHEEELSLLDEPGFLRLVGNSYLSLASDDGSALLIAFDQTGDYHSENFLWFKQRFDRFIYVDRVVVDPATRGRGIASKLYSRLFDGAANAGHTRVVCEVNLDPPNPASDGFHQRHGFEQIGQATLGSGKVVRYFEKLL
ncbi:MAG: GNAT family N-acetyltransferase [Pontixanthobacter sp.]